MKKYVVKAKAGIDQPESQELDDFTEEDFKAWQSGKASPEMEAEIRGIAHEIVSLDYWIEEVNT